MDTTETPEITAETIAQEERGNFLPSLLPKAWLPFENTVYNLASTHSEDYQGGLWAFVELSNGGMFMHPQSEKIFKVECWGNHYEGNMSAEAFGIGLCLHAFSRLSFSNRRGGLLSDRFAQLYDFAAGHAEASEIFSFID